MKQTMAKIDKIIEAMLILGLSVSLFVFAINVIIRL